jgi:flagellar motor protein MotB
VARELMRLGVKPGKIFVGARSDSNPIYYESMPAGEAGNRRAEIFVDY